MGQPRGVDRLDLCGQQCETHQACTRDVGLELSIDIRSEPAVIRLTGTLAEGTGGNLVPVVAELIGDGLREFELVTSGLCVPDEGGFAVLRGLEQLVRASGGHLMWDGAVANQSCSGAGARRVPGGERWRTDAESWRPSGTSAAPVRLAPVGWSSAGSSKWTGAMPWASAARPGAVRGISRG